MSQWVEIAMVVDGEAAEAIAQELQQYCHQGVSVEQPGIPPDTWDEDEVPQAQELIVRGYFPNDSRAEETKAAIVRMLRYLNMMYPMPEPSFSLVNEEDWAEAWKAHYKPVRLGRNIIIRPLWIDVEEKPGNLVIALDPGMAFGTGTHPTTQLCLEALEDMMTPGLNVLDLGCGSGILAIAAVKLGAAQVLAVDIDEIAVKVTIENATANNTIEKIVAQTGSLESLVNSARRFDLIVVNILAKIIIEMCKHQLGEVVRPGGKAIFSGIIDTQVDDVEAALRSTGLQPTARRQQGDWMVVEAIRPA